MMNWFGLNIPLMVVLVCCWAGIPLWHVLTRWGAEFEASTPWSPHERSLCRSWCSRLRQPRAGPAAWPARELLNAPEREDPDSGWAG